MTDPLRAPTPLDLAREVDPHAAGGIIPLFGDLIECRDERAALAVAAHLRRLGWDATSSRRDPTQVYVQPNADGDH